MAALSEPEKRLLYSQHRLQFMAATLDFVQLQQIDFAAGFSCACWQGAAAQAVICAASCEPPLTHQHVQMESLVMA